MIGRARLPKGLQPCREALGAYQNAKIHYAHKRAEPWFYRGPRLGASPGLTKSLGR
jgi:hypothetical protein